MPSRLSFYVLPLVVASSVAGQALAMSKDEACAQMGGAAESVMRARQNGIAMQKVLDVINDTQSGAGKDGFRAIVMMAYDQPRFNTEENKKRAVDDFRDQVQLYCMKLED